MPHDSHSLLSESGRWSRPVSRIREFGIRLPRFLFICFILNCLTININAAVNTPVKSDNVVFSFMFRQGVSKVEPSYRDNRAQLDSFINKVTEIHRGDSHVSGLNISAYASPEGPLKLNRRLARERVHNIADYLKKKLPFLPDSAFRLNAGGINWQGLERLVGNSDMECRDEVLVILRDTPEETSRLSKSVESRLDALRNLHGGKPYKYMYREFFPQLRNAGMGIPTHYGRQSFPKIPDFPDLPAAPLAKLPVPQMDCDTIIAPLYRQWQRHAYVKTNLPAWLCFWTNIAGEIDIAPHWSANLSVYYSGFDYFKRTLKFRTFAVMPEFRYWLSGRNDGFFAGAHAGVIYYNIALKRAYRYQDHKGRTPALGGGATVGYRFALPRDPRWKFEAALGYGIYRLDYDIFENGANGPLVDRRKRTFYGIDNVAFSICYTFDVKRKN